MCNIRIRDSIPAEEYTSTSGRNKTNKRYLSDICFIEILYYLYIYSAKYCHSEEDLNWNMKHLLSTKQNTSI